MNYRVVFAPEAEEQLAALYRYIASGSSTDIADRFTEAIVQDVGHVGPKGPT